MWVEIEKSKRALWFLCQMIQGKAGNLKTNSLL